MPQQSQYEGVMNISPEEQTVTSTASAFDPKPSGSSFGALSSPSQLFSPDTDPSAQRGTLPKGGVLPGVNTADLKDLLKDFDKASFTDEDILRAIMPISGTAPAQMPPYYTRQLPQPGELIQDQREVVGAGNARAQGIGNSVNAVIHGIAQFKAQRDQQQQLKDATKVQRLIQVQNGISQAEQIKAASKPGSPEYAEAQKSLDHNQGLMAEMLSDKKFSKLVEKGFNISLTDPSANKTPEHGAVQHGISLFKKANNQPFTPEQAKAMAQRFQAQQPTQLGPNVMAQQMLQYKVLQQQQFGKLYAGLLGRIFTAQSADQRAVYNQNRVDARALQNTMYRSWALGQKFANDQNLAQIHHTYRLDETTKRIEAEGRKAVELMHQKDLDPINIFKNKTAFYKFAADSEAKFNTILANIQGRLATAKSDFGLVQGTSNAANATRAQLQQTIAALEYQYKSVQLEQTNFKQYKDTVNSIYANLEQLSAISGGGDTSGAGAGTGTAPSGQPAGAATPSGIGSGAFDPNAYLNVQPGAAGTPALPPVESGGSYSGSGGGSNPDDGPEDEDEFQQDDEQ